MRKMKLMTKMVAFAMSIIIASSTALPVSAKESGGFIEESRIVAQGVLEDGTPYTLYAVPEKGAHVNIVDSVHYELRVTFPWNSTPPDYMDVSIPMNGTTYKGTLKLWGYFRNFNDYCLDATYTGTLIGRL